MPVTNTLTSENSIELAETMSTSPLASYYRDLQSTGVAYSWPYTDTTTNMHYRLQPLAINPAFLHFAQKEALTRAFLTLYDQRAFLEGYKTINYSPPGRDEEKPKQSYVRLIGEAILNSPEKKLVLSEIYKNIQTKYPYFKNRGSGWKNSIRHNLSLNDCFVKLGRSPNGKGHFWTLSPQHYEEFLRGSSHQRKFQKKPAPKFCYYPSEVFQFNNYAMMDSAPSIAQSTVEGRTEIHIPGDQIEVKHEIVVSSEDEVDETEEKAFTSRPFDVENLLATHPKRPASY